MGLMPSSSNIRAMNWTLGQREFIQETETAQPIEQRIAGLISELKAELGTGFTDFYRHTSMSPKLLEGQLRDKLNQIRGVTTD